MDKLSITKSDARKLTITVSLKNEETERKLFCNQANYRSNLIGYLSNLAIKFNLILNLYKNDLQEIIVFNFTGDEANIEELLEEIKGL